MITLAKSRVTLKEAQMTKIYDCIIIGGGPAGMTCALNVLRGGKNCLLIERESFGGQIATSPRVENIPSIKSISGLDFSNALFEQIEELGVEFELEEVEKITKTDDNLFLVKTNYATHQGRTVVIAAGVVHNHINLPKEEEFTGKGVSYCATCDGAFYKGQDIVLIGDANTAVQYALLLSNYCNKVRMYALFDKLFADKILIDALKSKSNVEITFNTQLIELIGDKELEALRFKNTKTNEEFTLPSKGVFIAIGQKADNKRYDNLVELDDRGFIKVNEKMETKTPGLYAIGDCTSKYVKQVQTACNDGAIASAFIIRYLG